MPRGHRALPHTADITVEAWAPTREECIAEAALGLVEGFADVSGATLGASREVVMPAGRNDDDLIAVLDEVIYLLETAGEVPVTVDIRSEGKELRARFTTAAVADVAQIGAIPKAVSLHGLSFHQTDNRWRCMVTIDV